MNNIFNRIISDISANEPIQTFIIGDIQRVLIAELKKINKKFAITTLSLHKNFSLIKEKFDFLVIDGSINNLYEVLINCRTICSVCNIITIINFNMKDYINIWERATIELNLQKLMMINIEEEKTVIWGNFILN